MPDHAQILQAYEATFARLPRLKLVLLTQVSHRHGLVLPVAEIAERARARDIDVIVDAAHGFGQIDYAVPQLKADFVGINLHKWIGAPVGVGAMYVRKGRVADLDPYMGETDDGRVGSRVAHRRRLPALPEAIALHQRIGAANKRAPALPARALDGACAADGAYRSAVFTGPGVGECIGQFPPARAHQRGRQHRPAEAPA